MAPPASVSENDPLLRNNNTMNSFGNNPALEEEPEDPGDKDPAVFATLRVLNPVRSANKLHEEVNPSAMETTFVEDVRYFSPGSMPHSTVVGTTIGVVCGVLAYCYYSALEYLLDLIWHRLPRQLLVETGLPESLHWIWIPLVGVTMALLVGLSVQVLGEPGDLSYTVQCVHDVGYINMGHVLPMLAASQFSILGGGSLGPEAPLVAICASFSGFISRHVFKMRSTNLIRKHVRFFFPPFLHSLGWQEIIPCFDTVVVNAHNVFHSVPFLLLDRLSWAWPVLLLLSLVFPSAALFSRTFFVSMVAYPPYDLTPSGLTRYTLSCCYPFSLEINNRFGIEYYEHTVEAIFSGTVCVCVFRGLAGLTLGPIWFLRNPDEPPLEDSTPAMVALGGMLGLLGAAVAGAFAAFHGKVMAKFRNAGLLEETKPVLRAVCGAIPMLVIAVFIPQTMFWGAFFGRTVLHFGCIGILVVLTHDDVFRLFSKQANLNSKPLRLEARPVNCPTYSLPVV
jgi:hypothetical protein